MKSNTGNSGWKKINEGWELKNKISETIKDWEERFMSKWCQEYKDAEFLTTENQWIIPFISQLLSQAQKEAVEEIEELLPSLLEKYFDAKDFKDWGWRIEQIIEALKKKITKEL